MKNPATVLIVIALAFATFCAVFIWNPPAPRFYPVERVWRMPGEPAPGPAMGWYGRTGAALGAAVLAAGLGAIGLRIRNSGKRFELAPTAIYAIALVVVACFTLTAAALVVEQRSWFTKQSIPPRPDHEY